MAKAVVVWIFIVLGWVLLYFQITALDNISRTGYFIAGLLMFSTAMILHIIPEGYNVD